MINEWLTLSTLSFISYLIMNLKWSICYLKTAKQAWKLNSVQKCKWHFINKLVFCHILMVYIFNCFWYNFEQCTSLIPIEYQVEFLHVIYLNIRSVSALYTVTHTQIPQWHLVYFTVFYFGLSRSYAIIPHGFSLVLFGIILPAYDTL